MFASGEEDAAVESVGIKDENVLVGQPHHRHPTLGQRGLAPRIFLPDTLMVVDTAIYFHGQMKLRTVTTPSPEGESFYGLTDAVLSHSDSQNVERGI